MGKRLVRSLLFSVAYFTFLFIILAVLGQGPPITPCRGVNNCEINKWVLTGAVVAMVILNMFVFDAVLLCQGLIVRLKAAPIEWHQTTLEAYKFKQGINPKYLPKFLMVKLMADRTHAVHKLVYYPFIALFLMVLSRNRFFDNWDSPLALIVIWVIYAFLAFMSTLMLRSSANDARRAALISLREQLVDVTGRNLKSDAKQVRLIIEEIENVRKGAYASLLRHPAFSSSHLITSVLADGIGDEWEITLLMGTMTLVLCKKREPDALSLPVRMPATRKINLPILSFRILSSKNAALD